MRARSASGTPRATSAYELPPRGPDALGVTEHAQLFGAARSRPA